jgi:hypothetical protein
VKVRYPAGTILLVRRVLDPQGKNAKTRPVMLVAPVDADDEDEEAFLLGVAITTEFGRPIEPPFVEMEYGEHGRCRTGLNESAVAHALWFADRPLSAIVQRLGFGGDVALAKVQAILRKHFNK